MKHVGKLIIFKLGRLKIIEIQLFSAHMIILGKIALFEGQIRPPVCPEKTEATI